jgi:ATP-binding cassette, subfamily B, heavy metal transporter
VYYNSCVSEYKPREGGFFLSEKVLVKTICYMNNFIKTLRVFYRFLTRRMWVFVLFILVTIISAVLSYLIPYFFKLFVDSLQSLDYERLFTLLLVVIAVRFAGLITHMISFYLGDIISFDASVATRQRVFKQIQDLDFAFHLKHSTGSLISAFKRGDGAIWSLFHEIHHRFLSIIVGLVIMLYFFNQINWRISLIMIVTFTISVVISKFLVQINITKRREHNDQEDEVSAIIVDNMVNYETVKLFSQEEKEIKRLKKAFVPWLSTGWGYVNTFRLIDASIGTLINISIFLLIYYAFYLSRNDQLTIGEFVLILGYVTSFYPRLWDLVYGLREVGKHYADVEKYYNLLDYDVEIKDPDHPVQLRTVRGEIKFKNVSFSYSEGKKAAVNNIDLTIREGQSIALVGRSGGGKTTLVKLLMRFYDVDKGAITIDGVDISKLTKSHLRSFIGIVPQEPVMFNNTISYNLAYGKDKASKDEVIAAAKTANLHDFIESLPKKYNTNVGERGVKLSGGQKQRLAIARMVLSNPDIIIFDEATSQLDSENENLIQEALWKVVKNKTTIIIAHRLTTAMRADKIVVLDKGRIIEAGSHLSLLAKGKGIYKHLWDLQVKKS